MTIHDGCIQGQITKEEEGQVVDWLIRSINERAQDWEFITDQPDSDLRDKQSGVVIWINGEGPPLTLPAIAPAERKYLCTWVLTALAYPAASRRLSKRAMTKKASSGPTASHLSMWV